MGTTQRVEDAVKQGVSPHGATPWNERQVAEFGKPPPACGASVQAVFARYCTGRLKTALAPCSVSADHVLCSTAYLEPQAMRVFWRLRYRHARSEVAVELEALQRDPTGRLEDVVPRLTNEFEELWDLLLKAVRCDGAPR
jgi:hypothetical protein